VITILAVLTNLATATSAVAQTSYPPEVAAATQRWSRCITEYVRQADPTTSAAIVTSEARQNCGDLRRDAQQAATRSMGNVISAGQYIQEADRQISQGALRIFRQRQLAANPAMSNSSSQPASAGGLSDVHRALSRRLGLVVSDSAGELRIAEVDVRYLRSGSRGMIIVRVNGIPMPTLESFWTLVEAEQRAGRPSVLITGRSAQGSTMVGNLVLTFDPR